MTSTTEPFCTRCVSSQNELHFHMIHANNSDLSNIKCSIIYVSNCNLSNIEYCIIVGDSNNFGTQENPSCNNCLILGERNRSFGKNTFAGIGQSNGTCISSMEWEEEYKLAKQVIYNWHRRREINEGNTYVCKDHVILFIKAQNDVFKTGSLEDGFFTSEDEKNKLEENFQEKQKEEVCKPFHDIAIIDPFRSTLEQEPNKRIKIENN